MQKVKIVYGTSEIYFIDTSYGSAYIQADKFIKANRGKKPIELYYRRPGDYIFKDLGTWKFMGKY